MKSFKKVFYLLSIFILIGIIFPLKIHAVNGNMKISSIYLGEGNNGDATLVQSGEDYLLMDIGVHESYEYLNSFLKENRITHFSLYFSHFHGDHTGGFDGEEKNTVLYRLMKQYTIDQIYLPDIELLRYKGIKVEEFEESYYNKIQKFYIDTQKGNYEDIVHFLKEGDKFNFGTVNVEIIGPVGMENFESPFKNGNIAEGVDSEKLDDYQNNCSLVAKLTSGNISFLTAGDAQTDLEKALIKKYKNTNKLKATIYKMSHHGLYPANSEEFLTYIKPEFSFMSNCASAGLGTNGKYWTNYSAKENANRYGFVYMLGQEKQGLTIKVQGDNISLYRSNDNIQINKPGWCKVYGNDGLYRKYDYYYFGTNGYTLKGVQKIDGNYYYLGTGGYRHSGTGISSDNSYRGMKQCKEDNKKRYFLENSDIMLTGFNTIKDTSYDGLYYFNPSSGELLTSNNGDWQKVKIGNYYYSIYKSGKISTNVFKKYGENTNYFDEKGRMVTGWKTINNKKYYFNTENGNRTVGRKKINGNYYVFSDYGVLKTNTFQKDKKGTRYYNNKGKMQTGWKTINNKKYYFDKKNGYRLTGLQKISKSFYYFSDYGVLQTNTKKKISGEVYKFDSKGKMKNVPNPSKTSISKLSTKSKSITIKWKKKKSVDGYQVYYATSKNGKYKEAKTVKGDKKDNYKIKKLKKGKKYYIKIRTYKKVGKYKLYSKFSTKKSIKVK